MRETVSTQDVARYFHWSNQEVLNSIKESTKILYKADHKLNISDCFIKANGTYQVTLTGLYALGMLMSYKHSIKWRIQFLQTFDKIEDHMKSLISYQNLGLSKSRNKYRLRKK